MCFHTFDRDEYTLLIHIVDILHYYIKLLYKVLQYVKEFIDSRVVDIVGSTLLQALAAPGFEIRVLLHELPLPGSPNWLTSNITGIICKTRW